MKELNFIETRSQINRARMNRQSWFVVFGASRLHKDQKINTQDLAERMNSLYHHVDAVDLHEDLHDVLSTYTHMRDQKVW